jgi:hypothetical protein
MTVPDGPLEALLHSSRQQCTLFLCIAQMTALREVLWLRITDIHDAPDCYLCLEYMPRQSS